MSVNNVDHNRSKKSLNWSKLFGELRFALNNLDSDSLLSICRKGVEQDAGRFFQEFGMYIAQGILRFRTNIKVAEVFEEGFQKKFLFSDFVEVYNSIDEAKREQFREILNFLPILTIDPGSEELFFQFLREGVSFDNLTHLDICFIEINQERSDLLKRLSELTFLCLGDTPNDGVIDFVSSLIKLKSLMITVCDLSFEDVVRVSSLQGLESLELSAANIGDTHLEALVHLTNLTHLSLNDNRIGDSGMLTLLNSPSLRGLTTLCLAGNRIGYSGIESLVRSKYVVGLNHLNLGGNSLYSDEVKLLFNAPNLRGLKYLNLEDASFDIELFNDCDFPYMTSLVLNYIMYDEVVEAGLEYSSVIKFDINY